MATAGKNLGGRVQFKQGQRAQLLLLTGQVDPQIYVIESEPVEDVEKLEKPNVVRSDRKGYIPLRKENGNKFTKVQHRRILPLGSDNKATVIQSSDKCRAICPKCGNVFDVEPDSTGIHCTKDGNFKLNWLGVKPMTTKDAPATDEATKADKPKTEKTTRPAKVAKAPILVDFDVLTKLANCELWTKKNVKFDHANVDVAAHEILFTGDTPRKYCFNTYNGALGKKSAELPIEQFLNNTEVVGGKRNGRPWFNVKDLDKERAELTKKDYTKS